MFFFIEVDRLKLSWWRLDPDLLRVERPFSVLTVATSMPRVVIAEVRIDKT